MAWCCQKEPGPAEGRIDSERSNAAERRSVGDAAVDGRSESERQKQRLGRSRAQADVVDDVPKTRKGSL